MKSGKALLVLAAVTVGFAFSTVANAGASLIGAERYPSALGGEQLEELTFGTEVGSLKCKKATFGGTLAELSESVSLSPTFSECIFLGLAATVVVNGCNYVVHPGEESGSNEFGATLDVSCPAGKAIAVTTALPNCEVQVGGQTGLSALKLTDEATGPRRVAVKFEVSGATYNVTKDGGFCPFSGTGVRTNGTMGGKAAVTASAEAVPVGIFALAEASIFCAATETEECQDKLKFPFKFKASAPTAKIVIGATTVECETSNLELEAVGHDFAGKTVLIGNEWNFLAKKCEANKVACTTVASEPKFLTFAQMMKDGTGQWFGDTIKLNITCGAQVKCRYKKAAPIKMIRGKGPTFEAVGVDLEQEKIPGEINCADPAKLTATFAIVGDVVIFGAK
jgi:hypothetical protein